MAFRNASNRIAALLKARGEAAKPAYRPPVVQVVLPPEIFGDLHPGGEVILPFLARNGGEATAALRADLDGADPAEVPAIMAAWSEEFGGEWRPPGRDDE